MSNQYREWRRQSKTEIVVCFTCELCQMCLHSKTYQIIQKSARQNIIARIDKICNIISQHPQINKFKLSQNAIKSILSQVTTAISSWRGVGLFC